MARKLRLFVAGIPYHVVQRGNNKSAIFYSDRDYLSFLEMVKEGKEKHPCLIYSYCLMPNHFHLLIEPLEKENVSLFVKFLGAKYVRYFNKLYKRTGTLWEGRFRASLIDRESYFIACSCYIEMNPVRAEVVSRPELYRWSSYRIKAFGEKSPILDFDPCYNSFGSNQEERQLNYQKIFKSAISDKEVELIREMTNKNGIVTSPAFKEEVESVLNKKLVFAKVGRPQGQGQKK